MWGEEGFRMLMLQDARAQDTARSLHTPSAMRHGCAAACAMLMHKGMEGMCRGLGVGGIGRD